MINSQKMEISLGLPVVIEGFRDGIPRLCYPFTLSNITMANLYLSSFNHNDIYENFKDDSGTKTKAMQLFFKEAFQVQGDDLTALVKAIDKDNFAEIVNDIKTISGIKDVDEQTSKTYQVAGDTISWNRMVSIIPLYTSISINEVRNMTLIQLNEVLELIQKKINWDYKISTISLVKEPNKHIETKDSMFYEEPKKGEQKVTTMKEIMSMM